MNKSILISTGLEALVNDFKQATKTLPSEVTLPRADFYELNNKAYQDDLILNDRGLLIGYKFEDGTTIKVSSGSGIYPRIK